MELLDLFRVEDEDSKTFCDFSWLTSTFPKPTTNLFLLDGFSHTHGSYVLLGLTTTRSISHLVTCYSIDLPNRTPTHPLYFRDSSRYAHSSSRYAVR